MRPPQPRRRIVTYERRILLLSVAAALPAVMAALTLLWVSAWPPKLKVTLTLLILLCWAGCTLALYDGMVFRLGTLANLLEAIREGDYSLRGRWGRSDDALGEVILEVNALAESLRAQRLRALEATALLRRVLAEIDVAVLVFDQDGRLRLANRRTERLLGRPAEALLGRTARDLGLEACLEGASPQVIPLTLGGTTARWQVRRAVIREHGLPNHLVVLSDVTRALREEERQAWRRLIQVLRHEINNSLAPIHSLAGSLAKLVTVEPAPADLNDDLRQGLGVIADRSRALGRFMESYARLNRLPPPKSGPVDLSAWVRRIVALERRLRITIEPGPPLTLRGDSDQLDQLLINLVSNAADASLQTGGGVAIGWRCDGESAELWIDDQGPGLPSAENLFVPFFTTKPHGTGIGLVLSQQIVDAHGGALALADRQDARGCRATIRLPIERT